MQPDVSRAVEQACLAAQRCGKPWVIGLLRASLTQRVSEPSYDITRSASINHAAPEQAPEPKLAADLESACADRHITCDSNGHPDSGKSKTVQASQKPPRAPRQPGPSAKKVAPPAQSVLRKAFALMDTERRSPATEATPSKPVVPTERGTGGKLETPKAAVAVSQKHQQGSERKMARTGAPSGAMKHSEPAAMPHSGMQDHSPPLERLGKRGLAAVSEADGGFQKESGGAGNPWEEADEAPAAVPAAKRPRIRYGRMRYEDEGRIGAVGQGTLLDLGYSSDTSSASRPGVSRVLLHR